MQGRLQVTTSDQLAHVLGQALAQMLKFAPLGHPGAENGKDANGWYTERY